jgi:Ca-activated chloride channel family protein
VISPLKAAELAKFDNIKVYTIGLGAEADPRALNSLFFKQNISADLDEQTLEAIAKMTGGRYFRATDIHSLNNIYTIINELETIKQDQATIRPRHDYYQWPLAMACLLLFYWFLEKAGLKLWMSRRRDC